MTLNRTTAPHIHDAIDFEFKLPAINSTALRNGLPLYWIDAGVQEVAQIDWVFPAGIWYENDGSVAHAAAGLLKNGTSRHTSEQISEALEFYGAQLKVNPGNDLSTVTLYCLTKHLPSLLPMVYEILTDAIYPQHELEIYTNNVIQRLLVNLRQCEFVANQRIDATLFGENHPYGRFSKQEKIANLNRESLLSFYKRHYDLSRAKIFMGGKVGNKEVQLLNDIFGSYNSSAQPLQVPSFDVQSSTERIHHISNDPNGVQGAIRIGRLFPNRHHPDYSPMVVLNTLFGGYFGSRLMSNIREDKGYTYGIYSSMSPDFNGGSLVIQTETGRAVTEDAVKEIYKEMDLICAEKADDEEILLVKNYLLGSLLGDLDGPFSILARWRSLINNGFNENKFYENINIYKNITAGELRDLAGKYFNKKDYYEIVVI